MRPEALSLSVARDAWREVSRHLEIAASARSLFAVVQREAPVEWLLVWRIDGRAGRGELAGVAGAVPADLPRRVELSGSGARELELLARGASAVWCEDRTVGAAARALVPSMLDAAGPPALGFVLGAVMREEEVVGAVVFGGSLAAWAPSFATVVEPFGVALANDQRLHDLARLREAAEADRQALLMRLDRQGVSDTIVGAEDGLRDVMQRVDQVARTDAPVMILGETGSGKEVVARAIHERSGRARGPFLRVNCGAIPPELVDSELFGHERGAFTGATAVRRGWFERADGGTLFLDEIGDLPPAAQVRLLRVLQDGSFYRVGGAEPVQVDVRVVAATHRDMHAFVREGRFREDLWYRVGVFPLLLPPLRARPGDIPALVQHFAARAGRRLFGVPLEATASDLARLCAYPWPGNVRELVAVIERAAILGDGLGLDVRTALGAAPEPERGMAPRAAFAVRGLGVQQGAPSAPAGGDERVEITAALERCLGRIEGPFGAAQALGVNPHTLRSRMRRLGIDWAAWRTSRR